MIRQAFSVFDKEGKGFVSATDISRVLTESGEGGLSEEVRRTNLPLITAVRFFVSYLVHLFFGWRETAVWGAFRAG